MISFKGNSELAEEVYLALQTRLMFVKKDFTPEVINLLNNDDFDGIIQFIKDYKKTVTLINSLVQDIDNDACENNASEEKKRDDVFIPSDNEDIVTAFNCEIKKLNRCNDF